MDGSAGFFCHSGIPDCDALQADACGPGYRYDALTRLVLQSKDDMRRRDALSPDLADAVVLTFAQPVTLKPSRFLRKIEYPPTGVDVVEKLW
jgi:hypothetical protein